MRWPALEPYRRQLARLGLAGFLLHVDHLRSWRLEVASDGVCSDRGESVAVSVVALKAGRLSAWSSTDPPAGPNDSLAEAVAASVAGPRRALPTFAPGRFVDWDGDPEAVVESFRRQLTEICRRAGARLRWVELALEQRALRLVAADGSSREVVRHTATLEASCRVQGSSFKLIAPLSSPDPREVGRILARGLRHARTRAHAEPVGAGRGTVVVGPLAAAQLLARLVAGAARLPAGLLPGRPGLAWDDLGAPMGPDARFFAHRAALPEAGGAGWWVPPGSLASWCLGTPRLLLRQLEVITMGRKDVFSVVASGIGWSKRGRRLFARAQLDLPHELLLDALANPERRGRVSRGTGFTTEAARCLFVPSLLLGELSWSQR